RPSFFAALLAPLRTQPRSLDSDSQPVPYHESEPEPVHFDRDEELAEIGVGFPSDIKVARDRAGELLNAVGKARDPISFEIVGTDESISLQFASTRSDRAALYQQIPAYFPEVTIWEQPDFLSRRWNAAHGPRAMVDFGLSREFMLPVRLARDFDVDPLIP